MSRREPAVQTTGLGGLHQMPRDECAGGDQDRFRPTQSPRVPSRRRSMHQLPPHSPSIGAVLRPMPQLRSEYALKADGAESCSIAHRSMAEAGRTIDEDEVARFSRLSEQWWNPRGP